ncbi:MAG: hypothetical protein DDT34_02224 [Firmicutes bacterium]|nr:hypothetical protein [Bacillota bacterium]
MYFEAPVAECTSIIEKACVATALEVEVGKHYFQHTTRASLGAVVVPRIAISVHFDTLAGVAYHTQQTAAHYPQESTIGIASGRKTETRPINKLQNTIYQDFIIVSVAKKQAIVRKAKLTSYDIQFTCNAQGFSRRRSTHHIAIGIFYYKYIG